MSILTWKKEFYKVPANTFHKAGKEQTMACVEHSLLKWEGLRHENLERHHIEILVDGLVDNRNNVFNINGDNCSLCKMFLNFNEIRHKDMCKKCPLAIVRNGIPCDNSSRGIGEMISPWLHFNQYQDPIPMIHWLKNTVKLVKGELTCISDSEENKNVSSISQKSEGL